MMKGRKETTAKIGKGLQHALMPLIGGEAEGWVGGTQKKTTTKHKYEMRKTGL
jgi:hypothetical protein